MKLLFAVVLAALYGLIIRLLFGFADGLLAVMSCTFLFLVPAAIGFLTVAMLPPGRTTSGVAAFFQPWLTSLMVLVVTIAFSVEGAICWVMIFPIFATLAGLGGLLAFRLRQRRARQTPDDWQQPTTLNASLFFVVPLLLGFVEGEKALIPKQLRISQEVVVAAPAAAVWQALTTHRAVAPPTSGHSLAALFGFPRHLTTTLDTLALGGRRLAYYEKGLYFEETVTGYRPGRQLILRVKANPGAISPAVMDEHILIGGKHLDILEDEYQLTPLPSGQTRLRLSSRFVINTPFNWYAEIWAHYLMRDILNGELTGLRRRVLAQL